MEESLEAVSLRCARGERTLFDGLNFKLGAGELLRVGGPNGSGKTTLLRIACGLLEPDSGEVRWGGEDILGLKEEFWTHLLYIGHTNALKNDLSASENLGVACALSGLVVDKRQIAAALGRLGLKGRENLPVRVLSQGQRRRAALARLALSERAALWILDEPFTALDAAAIEDVRNLIGGHAARGGAVMYTTHHEASIAAGTSRRIDLGAA
ncbi:MAG TPA: cytochrome c biogenesis heme-transporting ATPase CcmA [Burkholderiales bacterium]|nr:cytochrome c biogenesis heme-transporting ATPase CcmA [Burkholderiales bacterium]